MKKKVFVGLSGGVDSAVSAALLKKEGYEVIGVFIRTWHPDFIECNEEKERRDAMRVAAHLDIPFLTFDFSHEYKKGVADYMVSEYRKGRTPNPDVMCNKEIKFGAFLKKAISLGADYVATGHYAINELRIKNYELKKSVDFSKDQSYFLWTLTQKQLTKILFPVGNLKKVEVRKLAKKFKLPVFEKKDSQGICFLGEIDLKDFLKHYIKEKKGKVVDEKGEEIGYHQGAVFYTLGERHGFTITGKYSSQGPFYIVGKDVKKNLLIVSTQKGLLFSGPRFSSPLARPDHSKSKLFCSYIHDVNWISEVPKPNSKYLAQIRYHGEFLPCKVKVVNKKKAEVFFDNPVLVASGQSCVVYDKDVCLGGGIII